MRPAPTDVSTPREPAASRRPAILVLSPIYPWPGAPAEGIFVHRQVRNLARLGHRVRVVTYHPAVPGLPRGLTAVSWLRYHPRWMTWSGALDGVPVEHVFYHRPPRYRGDAVPRIVEAVSRHVERHVEYADTDVVYAHWLWTGGAVALALREQFGWPVAAIARGSEMHRWQSIHVHCRSHVERVVRDADLVLANCGDLRTKAAAMLPDGGDRIRVAYNGCDSAWFRPAADVPAAKRALGLAVSARYFVCCATIAEHKGVRDLASAWRAFAPAHPEWRLLVLGPVEERRSAATFSRIAGDRAELRGSTRADEVVRYLQAADAYVQPSRLEGLSNATMEAMSCALPVISTDAGGQGELIQDGVNGWLVPAGDPRALARAMTVLARDPVDASQRGAAARATIVARFDSLRESERLSTLLTDLHSGRTHPTHASSTVSTALAPR